MVYGLETLRHINAKEARRPVKASPRCDLEISSNPVTARHQLNRPWTKKELGGEKSVFETYAEDNARPFNGKKPHPEHIRA